MTLDGAAALAARDPLPDPPPQAGEGEARGVDANGPLHRHAQPVPPVR